MTFIPKPCAMRATQRPTCPSPIMPSVLPYNSICLSIGLKKVPPESTLSGAFLIKSLLPRISWHISRSSAIVNWAIVCAP